MSMRALREFRRLSGAERRLLLAALLAVPAMRGMLAVLPFRVVLRLATKARRAPVSSLSPERIARVVSAAARRIPGTTCLTTVLTAAFFLRRHGHDAAVRLGVAADVPHAHAWLESGGRELLGAPEPGTLVVLPPIQSSST